MNKKYLPILLTLAAVIGLGGYVGLHRGEFSHLTLQFPGYLILCALSFFGSFLVSGMLNNAMVHKLGKPITFLESLSLSVLSTALNLFLPLQGGMAVRALYLKRWHRFPYTSFLAILFGSQVLMLLVCSLVAATAVFLAALRESAEELSLVAVGVLLSLGAAILAVCWPQMLPRGHWLLDKLAAVTVGWHRLRAEPRFLARLTGLSALQLISQVISFWTACEALGIHLRGADALLVGTFGALTSLLTLTPGNLGIYEAAVAFVGAQVAINPFDSIMASLLTRAVLLVLLLVLTPPAVFCLSERGGSLQKQQHALAAPQPEDADEEAGQDCLKTQGS